QTDRASLGRPGPPPVPVPRSPERLTRLRTFCTDWLAALEKLDFDRLSPEARIDYLLLRNHLDCERARVALQAKTREEIARILPFESAITDLDEVRRRKEKTDSARAVALLNDFRKQLDETRQAIEGGALKPDRLIGGSALRELDGLKTALKEW